MGLLCGRLATRGDYCGYHDPKRKRYIAQNKRRTRAGELGIKLAKTLTAYLGCTGSGWTRIANKAEMNEMVHQAQAVLDALEGR